MSKVIVIGGGPAGMFAAIAAAECGHEVTLLEKNEKLGKKLFITGKGRCNITNASDMDNLFSSVMTNSKFLYSAFYAYDNERVIDFFETNGLPTKVERGNRVFPGFRPFLGCDRDIAEGASCKAGTDKIAHRGGRSFKCSG